MTTMLTVTVFCENCRSEFVFDKTMQICDWNKEIRCLNCHGVEESKFIGTQPNILHVLRYCLMIAVSIFLFILYLCYKVCLDLKIINWSFDFHSTYIGVFLQMGVLWLACVLIAETFMSHCVRNGQD